MSITKPLVKPLSAYPSLNVTSNVCTHSSSEVETKEENPHSSRPLWRNFLVKFIRESRIKKKGACLPSFASVRRGTPSFFHPLLPVLRHPLPTKYVFVSSRVEKSKEESRVSFHLDS